MTASRLKQKGKRGTQARVPELLETYTVHVTFKDLSFERHVVTANSPDLAEGIVRLKLKGGKEIAILTVFGAEGQIEGKPVRGPDNDE